MEMMELSVNHESTQSPTNTSHHQSHQHLFQHQTPVTSSASVQTVRHQSVYNMSSSQFNDNISTSSFPIQNNINSSGSASSLMTNSSLQHHNHLSMASNLSIVEAGLSIGDVADLLHPQYAIITGGRSREGCSIITFPHHYNFHTLGDNDYKKLILYLTSVPAYLHPGGSVVCEFCEIYVASKVDDRIAHWKLKFASCRLLSFILSTFLGIYVIHHELLK